jgi:hypothetical protein
MKIIFTFDTPHGKFCDALNLPDDHTFTETEIEAAKQERLEKWVAFVTALSEKASEEFIEVDGVKHAGEA